MRHISFQLTTQQVQDSTPTDPLKDVTRRVGWWKLQPGQCLWACVKCMGLKKGEKIQRIRVIEVVSTRAEPLETITADDVRREGFPQMSVEEFIAFFTKSHYCDRKTVVNRIEFRYAD